MYKYHAVIGTNWYKEIKESGKVYLAFEDAKLQTKVLIDGKTLTTTVTKTDTNAEALAKIEPLKPKDPLPKEEPPKDGEIKVEGSGSKAK